MLAASITLCNELNLACVALMGTEIECRNATQICDPDMIFENNHMKQRNMDIICDISKLCWGAESLGLISVDVQQSMSKKEIKRAVQNVCNKEKCNKRKT